MPLPQKELARFMPRMNRFGFFSFPSWGSPSDKWQGRAVAASTKEITNIAIMATGMTAMNFPITPSTKKKGINATIVVKIAVVTEGTFCGTADYVAGVAI